MIAICNRSGAFLYNCSEKQADERLAKYLDDGSVSSVLTVCSVTGGLDYTEKGERRTKEGMCGWLFMCPTLVPMLRSIGCEAAYIETGREKGLIIKCRRSRFGDLEKAMKECFKPQEKEYA